jgi:SNF2 family DNA or RNA helicase
VQIRTYADRPKPKGRMLVLCPKTLMAAAWGSDIEKFAPELTYSLAYAENRKEAFDLKTDVVIMNVDGVKWLGKEGKSFLKQFDHLVIDESTVYKHPTSQRSKAVRAVSKTFKYRYIMSGTPNPNSVMELWHQLLIVDGGKRLGSSYYGLRNAVQQPTQIGPRPEHVRWDDKPGATAVIFKMIEDITIRHAFADVMTHVPPNHRDVKEFTLSKRAKAAYDRMENDCILAFDEQIVSAVHAASLRTKLLQIASGAVYSSEDSYQLIDTGRYELIADLVEARKQSVVFFNWKHQRDELSKEFDKRDIRFALIDGSVPQRERDQIVTRFQAGEYQTILLHPRTGAHGLTLTAADTTILCSPIYEADLLQQAIHRIYRGAQNKVTNTILIQAKGTVEDLVYERLNKKSEQMADLLDLMKQRRK